MNDVAMNNVTLNDVNVGQAPANEVVAQCHGPDFVMSQRRGVKRLVLNSSWTTNVSLRFMPDLEEVEICGRPLTRVNIFHAPQLRRVVVDQCAFMWLAGCEQMTQLFIGGRRIDVLTISGCFTASSIELDDRLELGSIYLNDCYQLKYLGPVRSNESNESTGQLVVDCRTTVSLMLAGAINARSIVVMSSSLAEVKLDSIADIIDDDADVDVDLTKCPRLSSLALSAMCQRYDVRVNSPSVRSVHACDFLARAVDLRQCPKLRRVNALCSPNIILSDYQHKTVNVHQQD